MSKRILFLDVDGVLTDNKFIIDVNGNRLVSFNFYDITGIYRLDRKLYEVVLISGEYTNQVNFFCKKANIKLYFPEIKNKLLKAKEIANEYEIDLINCIFIGNDINDLELLKNVGLSFCPIDAHYLCKEICSKVIPVKGGEGVARYAIDTIQSQNLLN